MYNVVANTGLGSDKIKLEETKLSVNGNLLKLLDTTVELSDAPTVTHADSSNSGMVLNGRNMVDLSGWINGGSASIVDSMIYLPTTHVAQNLTFEVGVEYTVECETVQGSGLAGGIYFTNSTFPSFADNLAIHDGGGRVKFTFVAEANGLNISRRVDNQDIYIKNLMVCPSHELSRQDLVFIETWQEDISEKDFVYPLGNIQYLGADTDGVTGITAGAFAGKESYSKFGNWQADNALVGKGYVWSTMSEANKIKFVSNPENNCYIDGDKVIQVRYRVRVVQGLGDEWGMLDTQSQATNADRLMHYNTTNGYIQPKYSQTSIASDFGSSNYVFSSTLGALSMAQVDSVNGQFVGVNDWLNSDAKVALSYALPIALVHRRNQGVHDRKFNPNGSNIIWDENMTAGKKWYEATAKKLSNISEAFTSQYYVVGHGKIGGVSGRPDGLFYDEVNERDIIDLRNSSHKIQDYNRLLEREFNKAVAGEVRGEEGEWEIVPISGMLPLTKTGSTGSAGNRYNFTVSGNASTVSVSSVDYDGYLLVGDNGKSIQTYHKEGYSTSTEFPWGGTNAYISFNYEITIAEFETMFPIGTVLRIYGLKQSTRKKSNTTLHCDIIGNPANYYRGQTYTNTGASQTVPVAIGDVVWLKVGGSGSGTVGNFYKANIALSGYDLNTINYATVNFEDLGTDWDGAGSWRTGVSGTPLVVGENGENYIDYSAYPSINLMKLSKKAKLFKQALYSNDSGATWILATADVANFNYTANTMVAGYNSNSYRIWRIEYETHTNMAENAVSSEVLALGDVLQTNATINAELVQSLTNKIPVSSNRYFDKVTKYLAEPNFHNFYVPENSGGVSLLTSQVPAVKALPYITKENGKAYLQLVFKEMKFDVDWGDDSKFNIVDNVSTTTDDNANTVLIGQKRIELPYFIEDKE